MKQLDKRQFYLLMSRCLIHGFASVVVRVALEEHVVDVSRALLGYLQPLVFARGLIVSHGTLVHVSHVVELVTVHNP